MYFVEEALKNINIEYLLWHSSKEFDIVNDRLKIINNKIGHYYCNNKVIDYIKYSIAKKYHDSRDMQYLTKIENLKISKDCFYTFWKIDDYFVSVVNDLYTPAIFIDDDENFKNYNYNFLYTPKDNEIDDKDKFINDNKFDKNLNNELNKELNDEINNNNLKDKVNNEINNNNNLNNNLNDDKDIHAVYYLVKTERYVKKYRCSIL